MTVNPKLRLVVEVVSIVLLVLYVATFLWFVFPALGGRVGLPAPTNENEALIFVWTTVSVLVGGVVAVAFGQPVPKTRAEGLGPEPIVIAYAWAFVAVGVLATVVWAVTAQNEPLLLIKNAATAFFGLVVPIVTAYLKLPPTPGAPARPAKAGLAASPAAWADGGFRLCADFSLFPVGTQLPDQFALGGLGFTNQDPARPWLIGTEDGDRGLRFSTQGGAADLPMAASFVDVTVGTFAGPVEIELLDAQGGSLSITTIPATNSFTTHRLAAPGIAKVLFTKGGNEALIKEICIHVDLPA